MLTEKPRRGRPKGSGIDDRAILREVATRISADPLLKPTTAIKAAGVSDPSSIRRLRDKFRHVEAELRNQLGGPIAEKKTPAPACVTTPVSATPRARPHAPLADQSIATPRPAEKSDALAAEAASPAPLPASPREHAAVQEGEAQRWLVAWMSLGLATFNAVLQAQQMAAQHLLHLPPVAQALRQQVAINEMAMAICIPVRTSGNRLS